MRKRALARRSRDAVLARLGGRRRAQRARSPPPSRPPERGRRGADAPLRRALVGAGGGRERRRGGRRHARRPGAARADLQRLHAARPTASCGARCSRSPSAPASASARSSRSTPAAARPRPTPTSAASARRGAWCSSTRCWRAFTPAEARIGRRARARARRATATCRACSSSSALVAPAGTRAVARLAERLEGSRAPGPARARARRRRRLGRARRRRAPALARDRAPRRRVLAGADRRARGVHRLRAADHAPEPRRPRPAALAVGGCSAPIRRSSSGSGSPPPTRPASAPYASSSRSPGGALELGQALDALARLPARVVVLERGRSARA